MTELMGDRGGSCWDALPDWVPMAARHYLEHVSGGRPIRALARASAVHASTILRQVRRFEMRRDDPLIDAALKALSTGPERQAQAADEGMTDMTKAVPSQDFLQAEALRVLPRLTEPGAMLALARDMEMAVVIRDDGAGGNQRTATVTRAVAQAMALADWIACGDPGARIARYQITAQGRAALRRLAGQGGATGLAEAPARFQGAPVEEADDRIRHMRSILGESPLATLGRRRDKDGQPFLSRDLVAAGERLREDFELAQAGARVAQDWDRFLTGRLDGGGAEADMRDRGSRAARDRVAAALKDLGPGLGDVALRVCCYLEGLEALERRMGWAARSGKVVLRIALTRLKRHYADTSGPYAPMIG
jgi:hypothetical protein